MEGARRAPAQRADRVDLEERGAGGDARAAHERLERRVLEHVVPTTRSDLSGPPSQNTVEYRI